MDSYTCDSCFKEKKKKNISFGEFLCMLCILYLLYQSQEGKLLKLLFVLSKLWLRFDEHKLLCHLLAQLKRVESFFEDGVYVLELRIDHLCHFL